MSAKKERNENENANVRSRRLRPNAKKSGMPVGGREKRRRKSACVTGRKSERNGAEHENVNVTAIPIPIETRIETLERDRDQDRTTETGTVTEAGDAIAVNGAVVSGLPERSMIEAKQRRSRSS